MKVSTAQVGVFGFPMQSDCVSAPKFVMRFHFASGRAGRLAVAMARAPPGGSPAGCSGASPVMVEEGLGLDVAGGGELRSAVKAGIDPALLVLHGNAKSTDEIEYAVQAGAGLVVVDNADDVDRLEAAVPLGSAQGVLVRVVPGVESSTHPHVATGQIGSKFGLTPPAAKALIERIERSPRLSMQGVHAHVGSQILDATELAAAVEPLAAMGQFPVYDLGGGLGARYTYDEHPPAVADYLDALRSAGCPAVEGLGATLVGAFTVAMVNDSECITLWAFPDWPTWARFEQAQRADALREWRSVLDGLGADWRRTLMVDAPLSPMRIGRQPAVSDRRPLGESS